MLSKRLLSKIRKDLDFLKNYEVVLYGSVLTPYFNRKSDIDVAVITRVHDKEENKKLLLEFVKKAKEGYDIKIFELLPLQNIFIFTGRFGGIWSIESKKIGIGVLKKKLSACKDLLRQNKLYKGC